MKKLTKSMKIILISAISAVCVVGIVLGCVFGFKKSDPNSPSGTVAENVLSWNEQVALLGKEIAEKKDTINTYSLIPYIPYEDYVKENDSLYELSSNYFIMEHNEEGNYRKDFYSFKQNEDENFEIIKVNSSKKNGGLIDLDGDENSHIIFYNQNYAVFKTMLGNKDLLTIYNINSYTIIASIYFEINESYDIDIKFSENEKLTSVVIIGETETYVILVNLETNKYYVSSKYETLENTSYQIFDNFFVKQNENYYTVFVTQEDSLKTYEFEIKENEILTNIFQISKNDLIFEFANRISKPSNKSVLVVNEEKDENEFFEYSYKVLTVKNNELSFENYEIGSYVKIESEKIVNTDNFYKINYYITDTNNGLVLDFARVLYKTGSIVFEYNGGEKILHIKDKNVLTENKIFVVQENKDNTVLKSFDNSDNWYFSTYITDEIVPYSTEKDGNMQYNVMDMSGNILIQTDKFVDASNNNELTIQSGFVNDGRYIFETTQNKYYNLNYNNLKFNKIESFYIDQNISELMKQGYNFYFEKLNDNYVVKNFDGNVLIDNITDYEFDSCDKHTILKLFGDKNYIMNFSGIKLALENVQNNENEEVSPFANKKIEITPYSTFYVVLKSNYSGGPSDLNYTATTVSQFMGQAGTYTLPGADTFSRTGYTLTSWNSKADGSGTSYGLNTTYNFGYHFMGIGDETATFYAIWTGNTYYVSYNSYDGGTNYGQSTHVYGTASNLTAYTSLSGCSAPNDLVSFYGWSVSKNSTTRSYADQASVSTLVSTNGGTKTYYAVWRALVTLTYYSGVSNAKSVTQTGYFYNAATSASIKVRSNGTSYCASITSWTAEGWRADTTADACSYAFSSTQSFSTDTTLYAVYRRTLTVSYNGNGNTGGSAPSTPPKTIYLNSNSTTTSSKSITLAECTFEKTDYAFGGWMPTTTSSSRYAAEASYTPSLDYNAEFSVTMYANWRPDGLAMNLDTTYSYFADSVYPLVGYSYTPTYSGIYTLTNNTDKFYLSLWFNLLGAVKFYSLICNTDTSYSSLKTNILLAGNASSSSTIAPATIQNSITPEVLKTGSFLTTQYYNDESTFDTVMYLEAGVKYYIVASVSRTSSSADPSGSLRLTRNGHNTITLNNQSATTAGTTYLYGGRYGYETTDIKNTPLYGTATTSAHVDSITIPEKTGYIFGGYYTETGGSGTQVIDGNGTINVSNMNSSFASSGTAFAKWTPITYTIDFNANNNVNKPSDATYSPSVSPTSISATYDVDYTMPTPTLTGWTATGWATTVSGSVVYNLGATYRNFTTVNNATVTLYAQYTKNNYYITYESNKPIASSAALTGTVADTIATFDGDSTITSELYSITGWTLSGWSTSSTATSPTYLPGGTYSKMNLTTVKNGTATLYAVWRKNNYTIELNPNGGTVSAQTATSGLTFDSSLGTNGRFKATYDTTGIFTNSIKKPGYMFAGWTISTNAGSANVVPSNTSYANFTSYYDSNANTDNAISLKTTILNLTSTDGANVELIAKWTAITYYVELSNATSSGSTSVTITYPADTVISGLTFSSPRYTMTYGVEGKFKIIINRLGYLFAGWNKTSGITHEETLNNDTSGSITVTTTAIALSYVNKGVVTLTTQWTPITYKFIIDSDGGSVLSGTVSSGVTKVSDTQFTATFDTQAIFTNQIKKNGYMFDGWTTSILNPSDVVISPVPVTIPYNSLNVTPVNASYANFTAYYNANANKDTANEINVKTTAKNNHYINNCKVKLKAKWIAIAYNLVYEARKPVSALYGVTASNDPVGTTASSTAVYGVNSTFSSNAFTLFGWTYTGWTNENSTTKKWSSGEITTTPANLTTVNGGTVTVYATWRQNEYSIIYKTNGGSNSVSGGKYPETALFDSVFEVSIPARTGYTFTKYTIYTFTTNNKKYHGATIAVASEPLLESETSLEVSSSANHFYKNLCSADGGSITFETTWTVNKYNIVYNYNDTQTGSTTRAVAGTNAPTQMTYDIWSNVSNPTRLGYTFNGWTITGMSDDCTHYYGTGTEEANYTTTTATSVSPSSSQVYFLNLHSTNNATVTFTARWTANTYYIIYDYNDNESNATTTVSETSKVYTGTISLLFSKYNGLKYLAVSFDSWVTIPNPVRIGYTFTGWSISNMSSTCYHDYGTGTSSGQYSSTTATVLSVKNTAVTKFRNLHSNSYTGVIWYNGDVNFKANWSANNYKISYSLGTTGGGLGSGIFPTSATFDTTFYMDAPSVYPFGYHFDGWTISGMSTNCSHYYGTSSSSLTSFTGSSKTVPATTRYYKSLTSTKNATVTFTAIWTPNVYNINYVLTDIKGGNGHFESTPPSTASYDSRFTLADPIRTGYTFLGWSLSGLSDDCTHYYGTSDVAFESTNGDYLKADNPNEYEVLKQNAFKNLHCEQGATVTLTANWRPNQYQITYHYMPGNYNTASLDKDTINTVSQMTSTKTQGVTYDATFMTFRMSTSDSDTNGVAVPKDVKILYWIFYASTQTGSKRVATMTNDGDIVLDHNRTLLPETEYIYNSNSQWGETYYSLFGANVHAYAVYGFVDITVKLMYAPKVVHTNNLSNYVEGTTYYAKTYNNFTYPATVPYQSGRTLLGYWISSNYYIDGEITRESVTTYEVDGNFVSATAGATAKWGYPSTLAMDPSTPTFYLYAVYDDRIQSLYSCSATNSLITIDTRGRFEVGHKYKLTIRGFESSSNNDYTYLFFGTSAPASEWGTINSHTNKETSKYTAVAENRTTMTVTFTATASDNNYYLNLYFNQYNSTSQGTSVDLLSILSDMDIQFSEVINKDDGESVTIPASPDANVPNIYAFNGTTVYDSTTFTFGSYPQTKVTDSSLISTLNSAAGTLPTNGNNRNWTSYGYYKGTGATNSGTNTTDYMWYQDVTSGSDKYRGVYFTSYRPYYTYQVGNNASRTYQNNNGYVLNTVYWFKWEPLKWRKLKIEDNKAILLCQTIIDCQDYYDNTKNRTINGNTVYPNNYVESNIRKWLNEIFYQTAFTELEMSIIETTTVDNSKETTNNTSTNNYASESTLDKVYLLSYQEANSTENFANEGARKMTGTDYAKAQGLYKNSAGYSFWWLRSPMYDYSDGACDVDCGGGVYSGDNVDFPRVGVLPALQITL